MDKFGWDNISSLILAGLNMQQKLGDENLSVKNSTDWGEAGQDWLTPVSNQKAD